MEALQEVEDGLYRMEMGLLLLKGLEARTTKEPNGGRSPYNFSSLGVEFAWNGFVAALSASEDIRNYLEGRR